MGKIHNVKQGSRAWFDLRLGKITGSKIADLLTQPRAKKDKENGVLSASSQKYMDSLIGQLMTGKFEDIHSKAMEWGTENEPYARKEYEEMYFNKVEEVGFVEMNKHVGCSPDGNICVNSENGIIEIKCPYNTANHIKTIRTNEIPKEYYPQVQFNMWVSDATFCDFISYDPRIKKKYLENKVVAIKILRDEPFIENMSNMIDNFVEQMKQVIVI